MIYPKKQYLLARTRGRRTDYFYGTKLGELITQRVKIGDEFFATTLTRGDWAKGTRTGKNRYAYGSRS